jgi:CYTH domain-containing protein
MPLEIERKFLVAGDGWRGLGTVVPIRQGYLASSEGLSVRVRQAGPRGFLTVKGGKGIVRAEYEYEIPLDEATEMLDRLCRPPLIEKQRHVLDLDGIEWVVDEFEGALAGLILAEIELESAEQQVALPDWLGREVTDDPRYLNASLAKDGLPRED